MSDEGIITPLNLVMPDTDEDRATAALREATIMALGPTDKQTKLAAIRTVLEYTKSKPTSKSEVKLSSSEAFLAELAEEK